MIFLATNINEIKTTTHEEKKITQKRRNTYIQ